MTDPLPPLRNRLRDEARRQWDSSLADLIAALPVFDEVITMLRAHLGGLM